MLYDVIVIGGGPGGITAAIYARRANKNVLVIEKFMPGGQVALIGKIENYPGFETIDGFELSNKLFAQASALGVKFVFEEATEFNLEGKVKKIVCNKNTYEGKSVVLALGSHTRTLGIEGESEFKGKGVSYCAICDGNFFKGKRVAVVGSGDSAYSDGVYLSGLCQKVFILTNEKLTLNNYAENEFDDKANVELFIGAKAEKIEGEGKVEKLHFNFKGRSENVDVDAVFVAIGRSPDTSALSGKIEMNKQGYIKADANMHTSEKGVFVCGDVREGSIRQIATAVGDGAIAGTEAMKFVSLYDRGIIL